MAEHTMASRSSSVVTWLLRSRARSEGCTMSSVSAGGMSWSKLGRGRGDMSRREVHELAGSTDGECVVVAGEHELFGGCALRCCVSNVVCVVDRLPRLSCCPRGRRVVFVVLSVQRPDGLCWFTCLVPEDMPHRLKLVCLLSVRLFLALSVVHFQCWCCSLWRDCVMERTCLSFSPSVQLPLRLVHGLTQVACS